MSSLHTPQKYLNKHLLPPKPSTPRASQRPAMSFENSYNTSIGFALSPRNMTPVKVTLQDNHGKLPFRSNNSSPSHRRSSDVFSNSTSEEGKKFHEHLIKLETENQKLKTDFEMVSAQAAELEMKYVESQKKLRKKDEKLNFMAILLKETESSFKAVLENTNRDLEKIIQDQALKIKDLQETIKTQNRELNIKWESEKSELASKISLLEELNTQRLNSQATLFREKILDLTETVEILQKDKIKNESDLQKYLKRADIDEETLEIILALSNKIKEEVRHLKAISEKAAKGEEVSLSMILLNTFSIKEDDKCIYDIILGLEQVLVQLNSIRSNISDMYADKCGESCTLQ